MNQPSETIGFKITVGVLFLMPMIGIFSSKAMVPLLVIAALALLATKTRPDISRPSALGLAAILVWGGVSALWSLDQSASLKLLPALLALFAGGLVVLGAMKKIRPGDGSMVASASILGYAFAFCLVLFEAATEGWLTRMARGLAWEDILLNEGGGISVDAFIKNGVVILTLMYWPVATLLVRQKSYLIAAGIFLVLIAVILRYDASAAFLAACFGASIFFLGQRYQPALRRLMAAGFVIVVMLAPFVVNTLLADLTPENVARFIDQSKAPRSTANRMLIWKFSSDRILEKPITGWGLKSSRLVPGGGEKYTVLIKSPSGKILFNTTDFYLPLHPHNQALQIWLELGAVGALIVAFLGAMLILRIGVVAGPGTLSLLGAILVFDLLSFGLWQNWWIALQFLCLGLMAHLDSLDDH